MRYGDLSGATRGESAMNSRSVSRESNTRNRYISRSILIAMLIRSRAESTTIKIRAQFFLLSRLQRSMIQGIESASVSTLPMEP